MAMIACPACGVTLYTIYRPFGGRIISLTLAAFALGMLAGRFMHRPH